MRFGVVVIFSFLLLILGVRFFVYLKAVPVSRSGERFRHVIRLREEPEIDGGRQRFRVMDSYGRQVFVTTEVSPFYHYGDLLSIDGFFTKKAEFLYLNFPAIQRVSLEHDYLSKLDIYIKKTVKNVFADSLSPTSSALLLGIVFGGRYGFPEAFLERLRVTGVMHVIAASGMNVSLVATVLLSVFGKVVKRHAALAISIFGVLFYAFLSGFEPSIIRATLMVLIVMAASFIGKEYYAPLSLLFTAYVMLFYRPVYLFDVGFQLSFLSTIGILVIKPFLPWQKHFWADDIGTTLAAQVVTLPVLFVSFGQYGLLSILVNALVLWTVPFLMIFGGLAAGVGMLNTTLAKIFLWLTMPFLMYFENVVWFFGSSGWLLKIDSFPAGLAVVYYFGLAFLVIKLRRRK